MEGIEQKVLKALVHQKNVTPEIRLQLIAEILLDEELSEKQEKPKAKKKPLDMGKVKALHDAGWSQVKIAEEMHVAPSTICQALKEVSG